MNGAVNFLGVIRRERQMWCACAPACWFRDSPEAVKRPIGERAYLFGAYSGMRFMGRLLGVVATRPLPRDFRPARDVVSQRPHPSAANPVPIGGVQLVAPSARRTGPYSVRAEVKVSAQRDSWPGQLRR